MTGHPSSILTYTHGTLPCVPASLASQGFYKHEDMQGFLWEEHSTDSWPHKKKKLSSTLWNAALAPRISSSYSCWQRRALQTFMAGGWNLDTKGILTPDITDIHSERHEGRGGGDVLGIQLVQRVTEVISHDRDGWPNICLFFSEDLYCGSDKDRWAVMRADLECVPCHPSTGHHLTSLSWGVKTKPRVNSLCFGSFPLNVFK